MNDLMNRARAFLEKVFQGRNGGDEMSLGLVVAALALSLLSRLLGSGLLSLMSMAAFIWCIWRMFSRNIGKRREENEKYKYMVRGWAGKLRTFANRQKNRRDYKYFKCPDCHTLIRLKRGTGDVDITCPRCKAKFHQKA